MEIMQKGLGQYYTKNNKILENHKKTLIRIKTKGMTVIDPFVGEGDLILYFLSLFTKEEGKNLLMNNKVKGFDIDIKNIQYITKNLYNYYGVPYEVLERNFRVNDSLEHNITNKVTDFILTNPPYLAKNVCKNKHTKQHKKYFKNNSYQDLYEVALNKYINNEGIWIIPNNFISSKNMKDLRSKLLKKKTIENINVYNEQLFVDTKISVCSLEMFQRNTLEAQPFLNIKVKEDLIKIDIQKNGEICKEWYDSMKVKSKDFYLGLLEEEIPKGESDFYVVNEMGKISILKTEDKFKENIKNNILIFRSIDTGSYKNNLEIGLYLFEEMYKEQNIDFMISKKTTRSIIPIIFKKELSKEQQIKIKDEFNKTLKEYREKYYSIFLSDFKNTTKGRVRKRLSFKEASSLIQSIINKENL